MIGVIKGSCLCSARLDLTPVPCGLIFYNLA